MSPQPKGLMPIPWLQHMKKTSGSVFDDVIAASSRFCSYPKHCYDFYFISDARTDLYLEKAKRLINGYIALPAAFYAKCRVAHRYPVGECDRKLWVAHALRLRAQMDNVLLASVQECAKWVVPSVNQLEDSLHARKDLRDVGSILRVSSVVTKIVVGEGPPACATMRFIADERSLLSIVAGIQVAPLWEPMGYLWVDKNVLRFMLGHESGHLLAYDRLRKVFGVAVEGSILRECAADEHACRLSRSSCMGGIKFFSQMAIVSIGDASEEGSTHPATLDRLEMAVKFGRECWGMSDAERNKLIKIGIERAMAFQRVAASLQVINKNVGQSPEASEPSTT